MLTLNARVRRRKGEKGFKKKSMEHMFGGVGQCDNLLNKT